MYFLQLYLGIGGNQGCVKNSINGAVKLLSKMIGPIVKESSFYHTQPWGNTQQPMFLNKNVIMSVPIFGFCEKNLTKISKNILTHCLAVERHYGRIREERWAPRTLDIDILFLSHYIIETSDLVVPHPAIEQRRFVLLPLAEIAADFIHPRLRKSVSQLLAECSDNSKVVRLDL